MCRVQGIMDRELANPTTNTKSRDVANFDYSISRSGEALKIAAETSSVSKLSDPSDASNPLTTVQRGLERLLAQVSKIRQVSPGPTDGQIRPERPDPALTGRPCRRSRPAREPPRRCPPAIDKPLKQRAYAIHVNCRLSPTVAGAQQPKAIWRANVSLQTDVTATQPIAIQRLFPMLRLTTLRLTSDGRLLGFDTGDWSMLLGGFALAGLLALFV